jgi:hypothetical protein
LASVGAFSKPRGLSVAGGYFNEDVRSNAATLSATRNGTTAIRFPAM